MIMMGTDGIEQISTCSGDKPVVINCESGSTVTVNIDVKSYGYPEWLDEEVRKRFKWEGQGEGEQ